MPTKLPKAHNYGVPPVAPEPPAPAPQAAPETPAAHDETAVVYRMPAVAARRRTEQFNVRIDGDLYDRIKRYLNRTGYSAREATELIYGQFLDSMGEK